jgi:fluoride exporter
MLNYFWVALGGAVGSVARFWVSSFAARQFGESFPWGTLAVNVTGSFCIGLFAGLLVPERSLQTVAWRALLMTGLCGGYTTFSAFSLQTLGLLRDGAMMAAAVNVISSVLLCLIAVWSGLVLAQKF